MSYRSRLALRTSGDPEPPSRDLLSVAHSVDRQIALSNVVPFREVVNRTLVIERLVAIVVPRFVSSMLFGLSQQDPTSIGVASAALMLVAVTATYLPARAAARTDPLLALREE